MTLFLDGRMPMTAVFLSGVVGHVLFNRLEPRNLPGIFFLLLGPPTFLAVLLRSTYSSLLAALFVSYALYIGTLVCSVVVYRLSPFHPLADFPGPTICKVTRLWACYIAQTGKQHLYYKALHDRYGTHIRTGPNHLLVCDPEGLPAVLGTKGFPRGSRYTLNALPGTAGSLISISDTHVHMQRRRIWDRSLSSSAVQGYEDIILGRVAQLIGALGQLQGEVDLSLWLSYFSFDFMGDLAFGGAFRLMEQGSDVHGHIGLSRLGSRYQEIAGTIPWIKPFTNIIPVPGLRNMIVLRDFAKASVLARKARGSTRKDIFYHLLDEEGLGSGPLSVPTLIMEATLAIVAGSDTTGTALSNLFFYLLSNPDTYARLQAEVDFAFPPGSDVSPSSLGKMKFLNAVINETLRLQPVTPNGVQREIPPGTRGAMVAGRPVPGSITIQIPTYTIHRDSKYFAPEPEAFRPERWLEAQQTGYKLDQSAYFPFSFGPRNCVGKGLALQELRMVVCSLLQKFEMRFAPSWDPREWEKNLQDCFILTKGSLPVILDARK